MKRIVLLFVIAVGALSATSSTAEAQRSGTMQVTARVLDTRDSWAGLNSARSAAIQFVNSRSQSPATVETALTNISIQLPPRDAIDRPRTASLTINYLRN